MPNRNFTPFPVLITERLVLRQLLITDDQEIFSLRSDIVINKYLDRQICKSIEDAKNFITKVNENIIKNDSVYWAITLRDSNKLVGIICLFGFSDENDNCEIGYELMTNFQGKGIMQEASEMVIDYAFKTIKVHQIEAYVHNDNQPSKKMLAKLLFSISQETVEASPEMVGFQLINSVE